MRRLLGTLGLAAMTARCFFVPSAQARQPQAPAAGVTAAAARTCAAGGPLFANPLGRQTESYDFTQLTATRNSTWVGVAHLDDTFGVIWWRPGHRVSVLHRFTYPHGIWWDGFVRVLGITPAGNVVADVQRDGPSDRLTSDGWVFAHGSAWKVAEKPTWTSVTLTGVDGSGRLVGWARSRLNGRSVATLVRWTQDGRHFQLLTPRMAYVPWPVVDGNGDIAYSVGPAISMQTRVLRAQGDHGLLGDEETPSRTSTVWVQTGGPDNRFYGAAAGDRDVAWQAVSSTVPAPPTDIGHPLLPRTYQVRAVDSRGDILYTDVNARPRLQDASGAVTSLPADYDPAAVGREATSRAMDATGRVAYTATADHLPHFYACR